MAEPTVHDLTFAGGPPAAPSMTADEVAAALEAAGWAFVPWELTPDWHGLEPVCRAAPLPDGADEPVIVEGLADG